MGQMSLNIKTNDGNKETEMCLASGGELQRFLHCSDLILQHCKHQPGQSGLLLADRTQICSSNWN